jgi:hypothetical protein
MVQILEDSGGFRKMKKLIDILLQTMLISKNIVL